MIDLRDLTPVPRDEVEQLIDALCMHCAPVGCERFLADLYRWKWLRDWPDTDPERVVAWQTIERWHVVIAALPGTISHADKRH